MFKHKDSHYLFLLCLICFCVAFDYSLLRNLKDALVVTRAGAEILPFLRGWILPPASFFCAFFYLKIRKIFGDRIMLPFILFFFLIVLSLLGWLLPKESATSLIQSETQSLGLHALQKIKENWIFASFFVVSELWGNVVFSLGFWSFVSQNLSWDQARRFYGPLGFSASLALLSSSYLQKKIFLHSPSIFEALYLIFALLWIFGFLAFIFHKNVKKFLSLEITQIDKTSPPWMDLVWILKKPHVRAIVLLILAYGFTVQGSEVIWKYKIRQHYSDPMAYASFITQSTFYTGIFSCIFYLFFTNRLIRMLGWRIAALLTPLGFFLSSLTFSLTFFWSNFDLMIVAMIQLVLCEVGKFALFDPTKEMGYLVLKQDEKVQAKAVADVIAARLGRTFGAFSLQGLMFLSNSFQYIIPNILILIFLSLLGWFWAIQNMSLNIKNSEKF